MFDWAFGMIDDGIDLFQQLMILIFLVAIATVTYRSRALMPVLGVCLLGAVVLGVTTDGGIEFLRGLVTAEAVQAAPAAN